MHKLACLVLFACLTLNLGCANKYAIKEAAPDEGGVGIDVKYVAQTESFSCGAAALEMVSSYWGTAIIQKDLIASADKEIRKNGFSVGQLKDIAVKSGLQAVSFSGDLNILKEQIIKGRPVIVSLKLPFNEGIRSPLFRNLPQAKLASLFLSDFSHFVVVVGFTEHSVFIMDPVVGIVQYKTDDFLNRWEKKSRATLLVTS